MFKSYYPDYNKISEIIMELNKLAYSDKEICANFYRDEEAANQLKNQLVKLIMGELVVVKDKVCKVPNCRGRRGPVYYPGKVHPLDGHFNNDSFNNLAMVCPNCQAHIQLSRFGPQDIWLLKSKGSSYAEIGRLLGISRERVRQLGEKYNKKLEQLKFSDDEINDLVKRVGELEKHLSKERRVKRKTDKRTIKKRIAIALDKLPPIVLDKIKEQRFKP